MDTISELIRNMTPLMRYNLSPGLDQSLEMMKQVYPELQIHRYKTGTKVYHWEIPQKWDLKGASLTCDERVLFTHEDHPIRVWSGSWPTDIEMTYDDLLPHVKFDPEAPDLLPWVYKYYWQDETYFGFSLTEGEFRSLPSDGVYHVKIDSEFYDDDLRMGTITLKGSTEDRIVISSDVCHPGQANDSLSGVACALMVYEKLKSLKDRHYTYLFTFQPEMIGTLAFLSHNEDLIPKIQYGIYTEMAGTSGRPVLQKSHQEDTRIDTIAFNVMMDRYGGDIEVKPFLEHSIVNDELILCHTGIEIPTIAFNRGNFHEYHTSGDCFELLDFELVKDFAEMEFEVLMRLEKGRYRATPFERRPPRRTKANRYQALLEFNPEDYIPEPVYKGPIFLSKVGLYVDINENPTLNAAMDRIMINLNGVNSCQDIADRCGLDFKPVDHYLKQFLAKDLIRIKEAPRENY